MLCSMLQRMYNNVLLLKQNGHNNVYSVPVWQYGRETRVRNVKWIEDACTHAVPKINIIQHFMFRISFVVGLFSFCMYIYLICVGTNS